MLSSSQRRFLVVCFLHEIVLTTLIMVVGLYGPLIFGIGNLIPLIVLPFTVLIAIYVGWIAIDYWQDLHTHPLGVKAKFNKYKRQVRSPPQYFITEGHVNIRVPKKIWMEIKAELEYEAICAPHTGWLLEYKEVI